MATSGAIDLAALALRIESIGLAQANTALDAIDVKGRKAARSLTDTEQGAHGAGRGLGRLENALTRVAFGLAGVDGPLGHVLDKFLGFAIGGGVTAGVAIGVGAIGYALSQVGSEARQLTKDVEDVTAALIKLGDTDPMKAIRGQLGTARGLLPGAQEAAGQVGFGDILRAMWQFAGIGGGSKEDAQAMLQAILAGKSESVNRLKLGIQTGEGIVDPQLGPINLRGIRAPGASFAQPGEGVANMLRIGKFDQDQEAAKALASQLTKLAVETPDGKQLVDSYMAEVDARVEAAAASDRFRLSLKAEADAHQQATAAIISSAANMIANIISIVQSEGSFFQKLGGIAMSIGTLVALSNPVTGAIIAGGGAIVSALAAGNGVPGQQSGRAVSSSPSINVWAIGTNDPVAQRQILTLIRNGKARGYGG